MPNPNYKELLKLFEYQQLTSLRTLREIILQLIDNQ